MKQTSRMSWSRSVQGSRPSTFSSPLYGVRPRIALSAVVLPAPLGPMSPRMRPSSTRKSTPSSAMVVPNVLRRQRASMQAMASALLLFLRWRPASCRRIEQFFRCETEPANGCVNPRPMLGKKFLPFAVEQSIARTSFDEHAEASPFFDKLLVHQFLISFKYGERVDAVLGRDIAHRRQRIAFFYYAVEYHVDDAIAKLAINRLTIVPFTVHPVLQIGLAREGQDTVSIHHCISYSDVVDYNTISRASLFFDFLLPAVPPLSAIRYRQELARAELVW